MFVVEGSILEAPTDAIVNAANSFLRHGAGLAKVIADAAAPRNVRWSGGSTYDDVGKAWWQEQFKHPLIPTGGVGVTSAGHLPHKAIIHAVGPVWRDGTYHERELLARCVRSIGDACYVRGYETVAVPAISCGIFGFPVDKAANILLDEAAIYENNNPVEFIFYVMGDEHAQAFGVAQ